MSPHPTTELPAAESSSVEQPSGSERPRAGLPRTDHLIDFIPAVHIEELRQRSP